LSVVVAAAAVPKTATQWLAVAVALNCFTKLRNF
jgi:hypothetical protein